MAAKRIAIVGEIVIATICNVEPTDDGFRVLDSSERLAGAGQVANELNATGATTLLLGVVNEADATIVKRMTKGLAYIMGDRNATLRCEYIGTHFRIDRGQRPTLVKVDAVRIASQIQQFRPDEIRLVDADDLILEAICELGMGQLIYRDLESREAG